MLIHKVAAALSSMVIVSILFNGSTVLATTDSDNDRIQLLQQQVENLSSADYNVLNKAAVKCGFSSISSLIDYFRTRSVTSVDRSRIKDLDDSGSINVMDSIAFVRFLNGDYLYAYSYEELDVTGDHLLDYNDYIAYMQ